MLLFQTHTFVERALSEFAGRSETIFSLGLTWICIVSFEYLILIGCLLLHRNLSGFARSRQTQVNFVTLHFTSFHHVSFQTRCKSCKVPTVVFLRKRPPHDVGRIYGFDSNTFQSISHVVANQSNVILLKRALRKRHGYPVKAFFFLPYHMTLEQRLVGRRLYSQCISLQIKSLFPLLSLLMSGELKFVSDHVILRRSNGRTDEPAILSCLPFTSFSFILSPAFVHFRFLTRPCRLPPRFHHFITADLTYPQCSAKEVHNKLTL